MRVNFKYLNKMLKLFLSKTLYLINVFIDAFVNKDYYNYYYYIFLILRGECFE